MAEPYKLSPEDAARLRESMGGYSGVDLDYFANREGSLFGDMDWSNLDLTNSGIGVMPQLSNFKLPEGSDYSNTNLLSGAFGNTGSESYFNPMGNLGYDFVVPKDTSNSYKGASGKLTSRLFPKNAAEPPLKADGTPDWMAHVSAPTHSLLPHQLEGAQRQQPITPVNQLVSNPLMGGGGAPQTSLAQALRSGASAPTGGYSG